VAYDAPISRCLLQPCISILYLSIYDQHNQLFLALSAAGRWLRVSCNRTVSFGTFFLNSVLIFIVLFNDFPKTIPRGIPRFFPFKVNGPCSNVCYLGHSKIYVYLLTYLLIFVGLLYYFMFDISLIFSLFTSVTFNCYQMFCLVNKRLSQSLL